MKTYLTFWFYSEGASPTAVVEKLQGMGFRATKGRYDFMIGDEKSNWKKLCK